MTAMKLHGIFAPLTTPFDAEGNLALGQVRNNVALYNKTKLAGYVPNGSTSESVLLLWEEVYKLWEAVRDATAPSKILIAGTGAESTSETIEHTNRAARIGYSVALVRTPSFYKPSINDHMLAEHYLRVADNARIPVMVYSVPVFTHVTVEASLIARVAKHPNIVGMKDSSGDMKGIAAIIAAAPREFQTLTGSAATLYEALELGAVGAILGLADVFPDLCAEIYESSESRAKIGAAGENVADGLRHRRAEIRTGSHGFLRRPAAPSPARRERAGQGGNRPDVGESYLPASASFIAVVCGRLGRAGRTSFTRFARMHAVQARWCGQIGASFRAVAAVRPRSALLAFLILRPPLIAASQGRVYHESLDGVSLSFLPRYSPDL
jgi:4-hydroxy-2-oxoglutarate aldolase